MMETFINEAYRRNFSDKCGRSVLLVFCVGLIKQTLAEVLFDDAFFDRSEKLTNNSLYTSRIDGQMETSLYGNFAPNKSQLWLDENGNPELRYYIEQGDPELHIGLVEQLFEAAAAQWSKYTCLKFKKVDGAQCSTPEGLTHGVLHVATFLYKCCSSQFGNQYSLQGAEKSCQKMCVDFREGRCSYLDIRELVSYTLGLLSPMNRPDRDDYVTFHPEQMDINMWPPVPYNYIQRWRRLAKCPADQDSLSMPVPFDRLSSRFPLTSQYVDQQADFPVIVSRDQRKQYLLEHRLSSCPDLSQLDIYQVNKGYGCDKIFAEECLKSHKTVPKCLNYGYLKKDCTCACSKYYTGDRCETKTNASDFCFENVWFLDINNVTNLTTKDTADIGIEVHQITSSPGYLFNRIYADFRDSYQYLTIIVQPAEPSDHISVALQATKTHTIIDRITDRADTVYSELIALECGFTIQGFALLWGAEKQHRPIIWCFSSFFLNETLPVVLRSRAAGQFMMLARSSVGEFYHEPQLTVDSMMFRLEVSAFAVPEPYNESTAQPNATGTGGGPRSTGGDDERSATDWARLLLSDTNPTGVIGAGAIGVIMLTGIALVACCGRRCCRDDDDDAVSLDRFDDGDDDDDWDSD